LNPRARRALRFMRSDAKTAIDYAADHPGWLDDQLVTDAIAKRVEQVAEIAKFQFPIELRPQAPGIDWDAISGLRNRLIHEYHRLQPRLLRWNVEKDLPELIGTIDALLEDEEE